MVMMFSPKDRSLLLNMQNLCHKEWFDEILYLELPPKPVMLTQGKGRQIYRSMETVLTRLKCDFSINNLFLCNINNYYVYFERINEEQGLKLSLNLLEEGLTTYKITSSEAFDVPEKMVNYKDVRKAGTQLLLRLKQLGNSLTKFVLSVGVLLLQLLSLAFRKNLVDMAVKLFVWLTVGKKYKYGFIHGLDKACLCFPEMAKASPLNIRRVEKLDFRFSRVEDETVLNQLAGYSNIFINQKYVSYEIHFRVLFTIFREIGLKDILIKLHPKEELTEVLREIEPVRRGFPDINVRVLGDIGQIPVEDLIYSSDLKKVVGLTSSALIYLNEYLEKTEITSIAERYKELCETKNGVPARELSQFNDEYRFFTRFSGISQYEQKGEGA